MRQASTASSNPGAVATKNVIRQPYDFATMPLMTLDRNKPSGRPSMKNEIARARRAGGKRSPMSELAAGAQLASPNPTPILAANSVA